MFANIRNSNLILTQSMLGLVGTAVSSSDYKAQQQWNPATSDRFQSMEELWKSE